MKEFTRVTLLAQATEIMFADGGFVRMRVNASIAFDACTFQPIFANTSDLSGWNKSDKETKEKNLNQSEKDLNQREKEESS